MTEIIFVSIGLYATMKQTIQMSILKLDKMRQIHKIIMKKIATSDFYTKNTCVKSTITPPAITRLIHN